MQKVNPHDHTRRVEEHINVFDTDPEPCEVVGKARENGKEQER